MASAKGDGVPSTDAGQQNWLSTVKAPSKGQWVSLKGKLLIYLAKDGSKSFYTRITLKGSKGSKYHLLAHYPACSIYDARKLVAEWHSTARNGQDPALERKRAKQNIGRPSTLNELIDAYLADRGEKVKDGELSPRTILVDKDALALAKEKLGERLLSDLEPLDFGGLVKNEARRLKDQGGTGRRANMTLAAIKRAYVFAEGAGLYDEKIPVQNLKRPAKEKSRERILYDGKKLIDLDNPKKNETGALLARIRKDDLYHTRDKYARVAIELALMFGLCASEICQLKWPQVVLETDENKLPPRLKILKGKTQFRERSLPLPSQAIDLFNKLKKVTDSTEYVFPARNGEKRKLPHLNPQTLDRAMKRFITQLNFDQNATPHDLRHTCLSGILQSNNDRPLAKQIAGHKSKGDDKLTEAIDIYDQSDKLEQILEKLQPWADILDDACARAREAQVV